MTITKVRKTIGIEIEITIKIEEIIVKIIIMKIKKEIIIIIKRIQTNKIQHQIMLEIKNLTEKIKNIER
jgi:hypothetical protein